VDSTKSPLLRLIVHCLGKLLGEHASSLEVVQGADTVANHHNNGNDHLSPHASSDLEYCEECSQSASELEQKSQRIIQLEQDKDTQQATINQLQQDLAVEKSCIDCEGHIKKVSQWEADRSRLETEIENLRRSEAEWRVKCIAFETNSPPSATSRTTPADTAESHAKSSSLLQTMEKLSTAERKLKEEQDTSRNVKADCNRAKDEALKHETEVKRLSKEAHQFQFEKGKVIQERDSLRKDKAKLESQYSEECNRATHLQAQLASAENDATEVRVTLQASQKTQDAVDKEITELRDKVQFLRGSIKATKENCARLAERNRLLNTSMFSRRPRRMMVACIVVDIPIPKQNNIDRGYSLTVNEQERQIVLRGEGLLQRYQFDWTFDLRSDRARVEEITDMSRSLIQNTVLDMLAPRNAAIIADGFSGCGKSTIILAIAITVGETLLQHFM